MQPWLKYDFTPSICVPIKIKVKTPIEKRGTNIYNSISLDGIHVRARFEAKVHHHGITRKV